MPRPHTVVFVLALVMMFMAPSNSVAAPDSYARSNNKIPNIQASSPAVGGASDKDGGCVVNAPYNNHRGESWIAIDPSNPARLVGMSKFFFDPLFYLFHLGSYASFDGGSTWSNEVIPGFDCQSAPAFSWVNTTDPILAFDPNGVAYSTMLPYSLKYNSVESQVWGVVPNSAISVVKSTDGGTTWKMGNQGQPLAIYNSSGLGRTADKQWMTADANPSSPFAGNVYVGWTLFAGFSSELWFSRSTDHGEHFSTPLQISFANNDGPFNTYIFLGTGPDGALYISYGSFPSHLSPESDVWLLKSTDGGQTFTGPTLAAQFRFVTAAALPNTTFRDGISYNMSVNPTNGHVLLALEVQGDSGIDVQLTESTDGGQTFSEPIFVNDAATVHDSTDQFQPTVAAGPNGTVAVAFYDRRLACPTGDVNILPQDQGRTNFCIDTSVQFFSDGGGGLQRLGSNIRVTQATWDPQNPGTTAGQLAHPGGPNSSLTFIGDYFGLALGKQNAYLLFLSNYNLGKNPTNDEQQFLGIVPIPSK